jgi:hypothetical protein
VDSSRTAATTTWTNRYDERSRIVYVAIERNDESLRLTCDDTEEMEETSVIRPRQVRRSHAVATVHYEAVSVLSVGGVLE